MADDFVELLSPARDANIGRAAILAGADAVYIGADAFGARQSAANNTDEIAALCDFAHIYGARVYVALNTILNDEELKDAARLTHKLHAAQVDALIVQDLGLLKADIAPIELHASTQCHIDTPEKAKMLAACGFKTLVLARELGLAQIAEISSSVDARIECFVHGALCVSYSGQCWLSHAVGGRSANRGACAQPCRMLYSITNSAGETFAKPAHYLSLKDMNRSEYVGDMIGVGVRSFKIEGRLKDLDYVKNVTAYYRRILDLEISKRNLRRTSFGESRIPFVPDPNKTFNRGYTPYHICGTTVGAESFSTPKSRGEKLGLPDGVFAGGFFFANAERIFSNSDGLFFENPDEPEKSFGAQVSQVRGDKVYVGMPQERIFIPKNCVVYRNKDCDFEKKLSLDCTRKLKIKLTFSIRDNAIILQAQTSDSRAILAEAAISAEQIETARDVDLASERLRQNLSKFGDTPFEVDTIDLQYIPHLPISQVNLLRRQVAERLREKILELKKLELEKFSPAKPVKIEFTDPPFNADWRANCLNKSAVELYKDLGFEISSFAPEFTNDKMLNKPVMFTKHCVLREMGMCLKKSDAARGKTPLFLESSQALLELDFDCSRCGMQIILRGVKKS